MQKVPENVPVCKSLRFSTTRKICTVNGAQTFTDLQYAIKCGRLHDCDLLCKTHLKSYAGTIAEFLPGMTRVWLATATNFSVSCSGKYCQLTRLNSCIQCKTAGQSDSPNLCYNIINSVCIFSTFSDILIMPSSSRVSAVCIQLIV